MGCSPSKGHRWNDGTSPIDDNRGFITSPLENDRDPESAESGHIGIENDAVGERTTVVQKEASVVLQKERRLSLADVASGESTFLGKVSSQEVEVNVVPQEKETLDPSIDESQSQTVGRRLRKGKGNKQGRQKDKKVPGSELKVDFPQAMVKAHQAAYAYLNPSISKYEALLGLLDQAANTQLSLQPMVAFMVLRYEEVTRDLEDIATEGEQMLREHKAHLAWPCPQNDHSSTASNNPGNPPPDLMQQLLQHSTDRIRLVGKSVGELGDSTLEEAADYFSSLSELLNEKLKVKKAAEGRLAQVVAHIEAAAYRKPSPEDTALHSEDSGIGAENESLAGSEKHRHRRESSETAGTTCPKTGSHPGHDASSAQQQKIRSKLAGKMSTSLSLNSLDSPGTSKEQTGIYCPQGMEDDEEDDAEDDEDDEEEEEEEDSEKKFRQRSNSSPPDPSQLTRRLATTRIENPQNVEMTFKMKDAISGRICFVPSQRPIMRSKRADSLGNGTLQWTEEEDRQPRRPQTASANFSETRKKLSASRKRRSQSAESLRSQAEDPTLLQLERIQRDLNQRMERMNKSEAGGKAKQTATLRCGGIRQEEIRQLLHLRPPISNRLRSSLDRNFSILPSHDRIGLRTHILRDQRSESEQKEDEKNKEKMVGRDPLRAGIQPTPPPQSKADTPAFHAGRNSVRRLIDTFSQKSEKQQQGPTTIQGPFSATRNFSAPITNKIRNRNAVLINNGNNNNSCQVDQRASDRPEDLDVDSLPPPPPEVLMDNSFECEPGLLVRETGDKVRSRGRTPLPQRSVMSQRLRVSLPSVTTPPTRDSLRRSSLSLSPARPTRQDVGNDSLLLGVDHKNEEAATLYGQARKIIHLRHAAESPVKKPLVDIEPRTASIVLGSSIPAEINCTTPYANVKPPTTPPVSRARMPPCEPSNQRLPNLPFKCQPTPPSHDKLPPSPADQMRLSNSFKIKQEEGSILVSCSVTPPSPSASPRIEQWTRPSSPSQSFTEARSLFCSTSPSVSEPPAWTTSSSVSLPQPWGKPSCGRLLVSVRGPQPFVKREQPDRCSGLTVPAQPSETPTTIEAQNCGKESTISTQKLEHSPSIEDHPLESQSDLTVANYSASPPEMCDVGQALECK